MNIIIPLGGKGERFTKKGFKEPKPLIPIVGKKMIEYVLDNINLSYEDNVLQNSSILLQGQEINVMSCFSNLKQKEYPMKYGVEKKLFFKNTQLISEIIHSKVKKYSLEDVFSELDIKYDL
jgi:NDP-sugar pyrophosphorylase family protein